MNTQKELPFRMIDIGVSLPLGSVESPVTLVVVGDLSGQLSYERITAEGSVPEIPLQAAVRLMQKCPVEVAHER